MTIRCVEFSKNVFILFLVSILCNSAFGQELPSRQDAACALQRAVTFFRNKAAIGGAYGYEYTADLSQCRASTQSHNNTIRIEKPGTADIGMAYLRAYERTNNKFFLDAAADTAEALAGLQLGSGGWHQYMYIDEKRHKWYYRRDIEASRENSNRLLNTTSFDDDNSQRALRMMMLYDKASDFKNKQVHKAIGYALDKFLAAQRPNGGWPQRYSGPFDPNLYTPAKAKYPASWSHTFPKPKPVYRFFYTINDNVMYDMIITMLLAYKIYGDENYRTSALRGGDFLIAAQMPEPQPAWAQQYNTRMQPAWARKFEPPAIVSYESFRVIEALMLLYVETGEEKYRSPIRPALEWLERSVLPDGRHARFYELRTNRPLYFNKKYELVYTDDDMPTHYAFKKKLDLDRLRADYKSLSAKRRQRIKAGPGKITALTDEKIAVRPENVRRVIDALDEQGRWIENGKILLPTFIRNIDTLSGYLAPQAGTMGH